MKVLSLLEPWASLVVIGAKKLETRSWDTKYRGQLLIHASKKKPSVEIMRSLEPHLSNAIDAVWFPVNYGCIIGKVDLIDTTTTETVIMAKKGSITLQYDNDTSSWDQEIAFGDYSPNRYAWLLKYPVKFDVPIPAKGSLSLWNFPMCKMCGCWEGDACILPGHNNCSWAEQDLCSHCKDHLGKAKRYSQLQNT